MPIFAYINMTRLYVCCTKSANFLIETYLAVFSGKPMAIMLSRFLILYRNFSNADIVRVNVSLFPFRNPSGIWLYVLQFTLSKQYFLLIVLSA